LAACEGTDQDAAYTEAHELAAIAQPEDDPRPDEVELLLYAQSPELTQVKLDSGKCMAKRLSIGQHL
jgi:hypothetical protein